MRAPSLLYPCFLFIHAFEMFQSGGCVAVVLARPEVGWERPYHLRQAYHVGRTGPRVECYMRGTPFVLSRCPADHRFDTYVMPKLECSCELHATSRTHG